ncbi:MAG: hypothetical protein H7832_14770 [Magnetococcus sp. DMHC-6]
MKKAFLDHLIVEMEEQKFLLKRRTAQELVEIKEIVGDKWLLTDFKGAQPRFMSVEAPVRYADVVVRKRMLEAGEASDNSRLITHWKRARGPGTTEIFYTLIDGNHFNPYEDNSAEDPHQHLFFSVNILLYSALRHYSVKKTIAVIFEHGRHVDFVVGRDGQVFGANRISSYSETIQSKESLSESLGAELRMLHEHIQRPIEQLVYFNWLMGVEDEKNNTGITSSRTSPSFATFGGETTKHKTAETGWGRSDHPELSPEKTRLLNSEWIRKLAGTFGAECVVQKSHIFDLKENAFLVTSLPELVRYLSHHQAVSNGFDRFQYQVQRILPHFIIISFMILTGFFIGGIWLQNQANALNSQIIQLQEVNPMEMKNIQPLDPSYKNLLTFVTKMDKLKGSISLQKILTDLGQSRTKTLFLDHIIVDYDEQIQLSINLKGRIESGFEDASKDLESFLSSLRDRGFVVEKNEFSTDVSRLTFLIYLRQGSS